MTVGFLRAIRPSVTTLEDRTAPSLTALAPGGRTVVAETQPGPGGVGQVVVSRVNADGTPDASFGTSGRVTVAFGSPADAAAVAVTPAGAVLVGATRFDLATADGDFAVARLTNAGALDGSFGTAGLSFVGFSSTAGGLTPDVLGDLELDAGGRIYLAGLGADGLATARLQESGTLDPSFGVGGRATQASLGFPVTLTVASDGSVRVAGPTKNVVLVPPVVVAPPTVPPPPVVVAPPVVTPPATVPPVATPPVTVPPVVAVPPAPPVVPPPVTPPPVVVVPTAPPVATTPPVPAPAVVVPPVTVVPGSPVPESPPIAASPPVALSVLIGGASDGTARVYESGETLNFFPGASVEVRTATADVTGDGVGDYVGGAGPGGGPRVAVIDGRTGERVADFLAFEATFTGGVFVAAADLDGDGRAELVVTPDRGGGPVVAVFNADGSERRRFFGIADESFRGGARGALGDVNADGTPDLVVSAGFLGGPRIAIYDGRTLGSAAPTSLVPDFYAFEATVRNGAFVAVGDADGDGFADLAFGGGPTGAPRVRLVGGRQLLQAGSFATLDEAPGAGLADFYAGNPDARGGARVGVRGSQIFVGSGDGEPGRVRIYDLQRLQSDNAAARSEFELPGNEIAPGGVYVG